MKALPVSPTVGGVRVLGTGLNRWDDSAGTWVPAEAGFEGTPDGEYVARHTAHQVILARNLNTDGAVDLLTPDGQRLRSTPVGLAYRDSSTGRTALLAEVRDCRGEWVSPTEILYPDAFDGLAADVRFTIGLDRFEQDVIIRAAPPGPQRFGLDPSRTQLVVLTEFHEAPSPAQAGDEAPGWLRFGAMVLAPGRAFLTGTPTGRVGADDQGLAVAAGPSPADSVPVVKSWEVMEGRAFLVEAVEYSAVAAALTGSPSARQATVEPKAAKDGWVLPAPGPGRVASRGVWPDRIQEMPATEAPCLAASPPDRVGAERPGLVLDYVLLTSQTSLTLAGDTTYYVTGSVNVQNLTIEGGTVVKYDTPSSARISVSSSVTCCTGPYRPAFFTHKFDSTVGELVATGDPTAGYVGYPMLDLSTTSGGGGLTVEHLRFRHAQTAVKLNGASTLMLTYTLRHAQFVRCQFAINAPGHSSSNPVKVVAGNLLAANVGTFLTGYYFHAVLEHLTADSVGTLASGGFATNPVAVTNSILANVSTPFTGPIALSGSHNGFWNCQQFGSNPILPAPGNPFQIVGGGSRYLTSTAPFRGAGTQYINSTLLGHLRAWGTTQPPSEWTIPIVAETLWAPRVTRSQGAPDLGYHYEALDYALTDLAINDASLTLTNGVAVATHGWRGLKPGTGGQLVSIGKPDRLNVITRYNTVQEQYGSSWDYAGWTTLLYPPQTAATPAPQVTCRFTRLTAPAYGWAINGPGVGTYRFTDCQFAGGELSLDTLATGTSGMSLTLKNCLLEGVTCSLTDHNDPVSLTVRNCTFWHGHAWFSPGEANTFLVRDTFFDATVIAQNAVAVDHDYNGYLTGQSRLTPAAPNDRLLSASPAYATGPLGNRYLPTTCALRDAGSQADAALAGLYHHTTYAANQTREQNTRVDVGFHYVGCTANQPTHTDNDTLPDWLEDYNGNGALDSGETLFTSADTDPNDGLNDLQTHELRFNVLVNDWRQDAYGPDPGYSNEQNTQWQPKVVADGDTVVVAFWDTNQGIYELKSGTDRGTNRMVGWAVSRDGGVTFSDQGQPPVPAVIPPDTLPWGDAGDPVLAIDRVSNTIYLAGTSERRSGANRGVPLWKSTDNGATFVRCETVRPDIEESDYPWIAVDDWPGGAGYYHDVYLLIRTLGPGTENQKMYLMVAQDGNVSASNWSKQELAGLGATMQTVAVGPDHVAYVAWLQRSGQYPNHNWALQMRAVGNRGTDINRLGTSPKIICQLTPNDTATLALLRSNSGNSDDYFEAFRHPALAVNPAKAGHLYVAFTDKGSITDRADVFFTYSTDGGQNWLGTPQRLNSLDGNPVANDQWAPVLAVKPDGRQMLAAWFDRRNDSANSLIDVYGRWGAIASNGAVTWGGQIFRITTESFPPVYPGTLAANRDPGHYDPVWPPGLNDAWINLNWWYTGWFPALPEDPELWVPGIHATWNTYARWMGEHNGACATESFAFVVWADNRGGSTRSGHHPQRRQIDVRLACVSWCEQ